MNIDIPKIPEVIELNRQAEVLIAAGKSNEAVKYLEKAIALDPMEKQTYFNLGHIFAEREEYERAEEYFKKIILIDKKDDEAYFHLGNIQFLLDRIEKGVEYYNKAIANGFEKPALYNNLGMVYEQIDNSAMAIRNYSKAASKEPLNPEYRLRQVILYVRENKFEEALEVLEELNQYCPDIFEGYHYRFEIYLAQRKYEEAERIINKAISLFPNDVSLFYDKIRLENIKGDYVKALQMIEEAKRMDDFQVEARNLDYEKAKIYAQKEDVDNCIEYLEKCLVYEDGYTDYEVRYFLMNAYLSIQKYDKLLENAEAISDHEDGESDYVMAAIYYRALSLKMLERQEEAKKYYQEAKKIFRAITIANPQNLSAYMFRILCHRDINEYEKAIELCDYILLLKEDAAEVYAIKAQIYSEQGNESKAREAVELAEKYNPIFNIGIINKG